MAVARALAAPAADGGVHDQTDAVVGQIARLDGIAVVAFAQRAATGQMAAKLLGEVFHGALQRRERAAPEVAEGGDGDHLAEVHEQGEVLLAQPVIAQRPQKLVHALGALAAGNALAAELRLRILHEAAGDVHHAAVLVEDSDDAVAAADAVGLELLKMQRQVKLLGGQKSAAGAADLHGLAPFSVHHAAAELLHDLAQRGRFLGYVHMTGAVDVALEHKNSCHSIHSLFLAFAYNTQQYNILSLYGKNVKRSIHK